MASPLQLYSFIQGEYEDGRKQHDTNRLRSLYQQALAAPPQNQGSIIGQVAAIDPSQAKGLYDFVNSRAEDQRKAVSQRAAIVRALPQEQRQAAYEGIRPDLDAAGLFAPEGADEGYLGAVAQTYGGLSGGQELRPHVIGNALVDASGKVLYQGESPEKWSLVNVPDGQGGTVQMEYSNGQFRTPAYQGSPQPQGITGGGGQVLDDAYRGAQVDPVTDFSTLAQKYPGVQVSSLARSPEHNAKVGGVANSYHVKGQGGDFVVPMAQRQQFMAEARQMGYDAIDEGDHVHLEPRRGVQASSRFAPGQGIGGQRMGYTPPKPTAQAAQPKTPARQMTPQELQRAGFAPGTVAYMGADGVPKVMQRPSTKPATDTKRQQEVQSQEADFQEIERLVNTLDRMNNVSGWSSTLMPFGEDRNTYQSTTGQLAVLLKPLIRKPGEGTWTDKDQELLERLVPKLDNYEGTNKAVIENIRSLIRSRRRGLGIGQQPAAQRPANGGFRILPD